jgi:O-antigen ligase
MESAAASSSGAWAHGGSRARAALVAGCGLAAVAAATGLVAERAFAQPTTLKYAVSVLAPLLVGAVCLSRDPLRLLVATAIIAAPFDVVASVGGVTLMPLTGLLLLATAVALFDPRTVGQAPTATGTVVVVALALLLPALATGGAQGHYATWLGSTLAAGWLGYVVAQQPGGLRLVLGCVVISTALQSALALYEFSRHVNLDLYRSDVGVAVTQDYFFNFGRDFRPSGTLPDPIALGNLLAIACPLAVGLGVRVRGAAQLAWAAAAILIVVALILSFSRMSWIAAAVGIVVTLLALPANRRLPTVAGVAVVLLAATAIGLVAGGSSLHERFDSIQSPTSRVNRTYQGDLLRQRIWSASLGVARANPVFGTGFDRLQPELSQHLGEAPTGLHAHSAYLQFLAEAGILGLLALLLVMGHAGVSLIVALGRERTLLAGVLGAFVAMLVTWTTDTSIRYTSVSALLAVVLGAGIAQRWLPGRGRVEPA